MRLKISFFVALAIDSFRYYAAQPLNDLCDRSGILIVNDDTGPVVGTNVDATRDVSCRRNVAGLGVWYFMRGTGNLMTLSTCSDETTFATRISAAIGCGISDSCAAPSDPGFDVPCDTSPLGSTTTFDSEPGLVYRVLVTGATEADVGTFGLVAFDYISPSNDRCESAAPILVNGDSVLLGTTLNTTQDTTCRRSIIRRGAWYVMTGTGRLTTISTCSAQATRSFATNLFVTTDCASTATCVQNVDPGFPISCPSPFGATITFDSVQGQVYRILVSGPTSSDVGSFGIEVFDYEPPANDLCDDSLSLLVNNADEIVGSTVNTTADTTCRRSIVRRGVWYSMIGTGRLLTISTCSLSTTFATNLFVTTDCSISANCVQNVDPGFSVACGVPLGTTITFDSVEGQVYRVLVSGPSSSDVGTFGIRAFDYEPPVNDFCEDSLPLLVNNADEIVGSTVNTTADTTCRRSIARRGAWYILTGTGRLMTVSTCSASTMFATNLFVTTDCAISANCVQNVDPGFPVACGVPLGTTVTFDSVEGQTYRILVSGPTVSDVGTFGIRAFDYEPPQNDVCDNPVPLVVNGAETVVSTINATAETTCRRSIARRGVWYIMTGTGRLMTVSTCSMETTFATNVFITTDCAISANCVQDVDPGFSVPCISPLGLTITFDSVEGQIYRVLVSGLSSSDVGTIGIRAFDYVPPGNIECTLPFQLLLNGPDILGSTVNASLAGTCQPRVSQRGVYYVIVGSGKRMTVSTCSAMTEFQTQIYLSASCDSRSCLASTTPGSCATNPFGAETSWDSVNGTAYVIEITGVRPTDAGKFGIRVSDTQVPLLSFCLSGDNTLELESGKTVKLRNIRLGTKVKVNNDNKYEPIFAFGHYSLTGMGDYLVMNDKLEISGNHLLRVEGKGFVPASTVVIGDRIETARGDYEIVESIATISSKGIYAPFTPSGTLVISGYLVSSYVALQPNADSWQIAGISTGLSWHYLSHAIEFPHRLACHYFGTCLDTTYNHEDGLSSWTASLKSMADWLMMQCNNDKSSFLWLGIVPMILIVVGLLGAIECIVVAMMTYPSTSFAIVVVGLASALWLSARRSCYRCKNFPTLTRKAKTA